MFLSVYSVAQSCLTLCDPMECSPSGSSVHGDSPGKNTRVGCHAPAPGDLPDPGIKPASPVSPALAGSLFITEPPGKSSEIPSQSIYFSPSLRVSVGCFMDFLQTFML